MCSFLRVNNVIHSIEGAVRAAIGQMRWIGIGVILILVISVGCVDYKRPNELQYQYYQLGVVSGVNAYLTMERKRIKLGDSFTLKNVYMLADTVSGVVPVPEWNKLY